MKKNKMFTSMAAVALVLSLAACGKSATDSSTTTNDADSVSSHKVAKSSKSSSSSVKSSSDNDSSSSTTNDNNEVSSTSDNNANAGTTSSMTKANASTDSSSSYSSEEATFTATDARTVLKQHFGNQAGNNQQAASVTQAQVNAVDNMTASYNGNNTWTLSGTVNGQQVSYTVSQYGVQ